MATHENKPLLQRLREESSITLRALIYALSVSLIATQTVQAVETVTYYHHDALGSPVAATDESGNLLWREDYKPYGERIRKPVTDNKLWYTGKPEEPELGLQYFGARWYDPQLGRFTGIDPVGFKETNIHSFNRYAYANNNPYRYVDPDGRWASQKGAYVHQRATYEVIGKHLPYKEHKILVNATVHADGKEFQTTDNAYRHAMSGIINGKQQTADEARAMANNFVRKQFEKAWNTESREDALFEFGVALHVLQDSTSPSHTGFQPWTGDETAGDIASHVAKEIKNPGKDSSLYKVTQDAWGWFNDRKLPDGDLFKYSGD